MIVKNIEGMGRARIWRHSEQSPRVWIDPSSDGEYVYISIKAADRDPSPYFQSESEIRIPLDEFRQLVEGI